MDGGRVASVFKVRCRRSCRPFCSGCPGAIRSRPMPRRSHQTASLLNPWQRVRGGEGHAVVRANGLGEPLLLKCALEDGEGVAFLGCREGLARKQIAAGEVGDRQRIAVPPVAEQEFALVVGAPESIGRPGQERVPVRRRRDRRDRRVTSP